jgi:predicted nucleic acid-binding protein
MNGSDADPTVANLLIDTDIFVDHLRGARALTAGSDRVWYSVLTRCELFAGSRADEAVIGMLLSPFTELPVDRPTAERAGRLRRTAGLRIADAIIAASALEHGLTLVTRNLRDFHDVPELAVRSPS